MNRRDVRDAKIGNLHLKENIKNKYLQNCKSILQNDIKILNLFWLMTQFKN